MGKRSNYERRERDFYKTTLKATLPLIPELPDSFDFVEPCAGDGALISHLNTYGGNCVQAFDIEPQAEGIEKRSALENFEADLIITNPPWDRKILHPMIEHFRNIAPTWLLFDADWMHTKQSSELIKYCSKIISIGRVAWINGKCGKDNSVWYLFGKEKSETIFVGR